MNWIPGEFVEAVATTAGFAGSVTELREVLGPKFINNFLTYKRNELERFSRFVTDWEFTEYAYHF